MGEEISSYKHYRRVLLQQVFRIKITSLFHSEKYLCLGEKKVTLRLLAAEELLKSTFHLAMTSDTIVHASGNHSMNYLSCKQLSCSSRIQDYHCKGCKSSSFRNISDVYNGVTKNLMFLYYSLFTLFFYCYNNHLQLLSPEAVSGDFFLLKNARLSVTSTQRALHFLDLFHSEMCKSGSIYKLVVFQKVNETNLQKAC